MILKKRAGKKRIKKIYYKYRKDMYHYLICNIYIYIYDCNCRSMTVYEQTIYLKKIKQPHAIPDF